MIATPWERSNGGVAGGGGGTAGPAASRRRCDPPFVASMGEPQKKRPPGRRCPAHNRDRAPRAIDSWNMAWDLDDCHSGSHF